MPSVEEDTSVIWYRAMGAELASRETALIMAEMIFKKIYGEDNFKTQLPLTTVDGGDRWIIEGSRNGDDYPAPPDQLVKGRVLIEILKANCQVLKLTQLAY